MRKYEGLKLEGALLDEEQLEKHLEKIGVQHVLTRKSEKETYPIPQLMQNY